MGSVVVLYGDLLLYGGKFVVVVMGSVFLMMLYDGVVERGYAVARSERGMQGSSSSSSALTSILARSSSLLRSMPT